MMAERTDWAGSHAGGLQPGEKGAEDFMQQQSRDGGQLSGVYRDGDI